MNNFEVRYTLIIFKQEYYGLRDDQLNRNELEAKKQCQNITKEKMKSWSISDIGYFKEVLKRI
jgi:hypothetical protein